MEFKIHDKQNKYWRLLLYILYRKSNIVSENPADGQLASESQGTLFLFFFNLLIQGARNQSRLVWFLTTELWQTKFITCDILLLRLNSFRNDESPCVISPIGLAHFWVKSYPVSIQYSVTSS